MPKRQIIKNKRNPASEKERDFLFRLRQEQRTEEKMKKVAIQGIKGSFHDIAAHEYFQGEDIELV